MKPLLVAALLAAVAALATALAVRRGVVTGALLAHALRAVALLLVLLGVDDASAQQSAAPPRERSKALHVLPPEAKPLGAAITPAQEFPPAFDAKAWAAYAPHEGRRAGWSSFKAEVARAEVAGTPLSESNAAHTAAHTGFIAPSLHKLLPDAAGKMPSVTSSDAALALADMEAKGCFDAWLAAYVWRRANGAQDAALLDRVERHLRVAHALLLAQRSTGRVIYVPWMKKSAAPRDYQAFTMPPDLERTARKLFPFTNTATWDTDHVLRFRVVNAHGATLHRRGAALPLADGGELLLRRLDLVQAGAQPLVIEHPTLGQVTLPAAASLTSWTLPSALPAEQRAHLATRARAAVAGDGAALQALEPILPAAHGALREALVRAPSDARGAPAVRMTLSTFLE